MSKPKPPPTLSLEQAKPLLEPCVPILLESFWEAWGWATALVDSDKLARLILHSSTMAGIVSDGYAHFSRPKLVDQFKARWSSSGRFHKASMGPLSLRFKKFTPDLLGMQVRTEAQRQEYQQDQSYLPGAQAITGITLGYTLDPLRSVVTGIYFTCPSDFDRNAWNWPIYQAGDGQLSLFQGTPLPPDQPVEDVINVSIKVKTKKQG